MKGGKAASAKTKICAFVILLLFISSYAVLPVNQAFANGDLKASSTAASGTRVKYFVGITPASATQHRAHLKMVLSQIGSYAAIELMASTNTGGPGGKYASRWISIERCYETEGGRTLTVEEVSNESWRVLTGSSNEVAIEYGAYLVIPWGPAEGTFSTYLTEQCAVIYARALLLSPPFQCPVTVDFSLPANWKVVTEERWEALSATSYSLSTSALDSYIALGPWEIYNETFGNDQTLTIAMCGKTRYAPGEYVRNMKTCIDYFSSRIGILPHRSLRVVLAPLPLPSDFSTGRNESELRIERADCSWGFFEAIFWHHWFLTVTTHETWWFGESAGPFFLYTVWSMIGAPVSECTGFFNFTFTEFSWKEWYRSYKGYIGTKYDVPVTDFIDMSEKTSDSTYYYLMYMKGGVVCSLLNATIAEATHGAKNFQDMVRYLYENFVVKCLPYTVEDLLVAANHVSGIDFKPFFDAYVRGAERLPVVICGNKPYPDWRVLGEMIYPSQANSENVKPTPALESVSLELKKVSDHFAVYFHQKNAPMAALLLLDAERVYPYMVRIFGENLQVKIKMFLTYDSYEYYTFAPLPGAKPPSNETSQGAVWGGINEIYWLRPISRQWPGDAPVRIPLLDVNITGHEVAHAVQGLLYPNTKGKYWLSWFSENLADYAGLESGGPIPDKTYDVLINACRTGNPPLMNLSSLGRVPDEAWDSDRKTLYYDEGQTFLFYIIERYGELGLQQLLRDYNNDIPLLEAIPKAFNASAANIERDWMKFLKRAAINASICEEELIRISEEGVDLGTAAKMKERMPFLALFRAYIKEDIYRILGLLKPIKPKPPSPLTTLKYDDGSADGFFASNNSGCFVYFEPPATPWVVQKVSIYGIWVSQGFTVQLWDQNLKMIWSISYSGVPPSQWGTRWLDVEVPNATVEGPFYAVFFMDASPTQISIGYDSSMANEHSGLASRDQRIAAWPQDFSIQKDKANWMIRVVGSKASVLPPGPIPTPTPMPTPTTIPTPTPTSTPTPTAGPTPRPTATPTPTPTPTTMPTPMPEETSSFPLPLVLAVLVILLPVYAILRKRRATGKI